jgi:ABC-2 type transport system ATP-binding protein/lipopolysaccharide transport system ATP-binding protein
MFSIRVEQVSKTFELGGHSTLKDFFTQSGTRRRKFEALSNVTLRIKQGESVAILGRNGSGKSTLLRVIAGVLAPDKGEVFTSGRVVPLLQLGAGFHPELTASENINLNASLLGLQKNEIKNLTPSILDFAGINDFMNTPIKNLSSGMVARLGFSIAAHVDPEIVLLDEILAVGDIAFQEKSFQEIKKMRSCGKSLITVTHSVSNLEEIADTLVVMENGSISFHGSISEGLAYYMHSLKHPSDSNKLAT